MATVPFIFIHIGNEYFPEYVNIALEQCRKWNPYNIIYFIALSKYKENITCTNVSYISLEEISVSDIRTHFVNNSKLDMEFRNGFWRYTTERLFVLYDFCTQNNIDEFIHLENDNMVYFSINNIINTFRETVHGISSTALSREENTFGIFYCNTLEILHNFLLFLVTNNSGANEMVLGSKFFITHSENCKFLPSIPPIDDNISEKDLQFISNRINEFGGIFDPAQYGQWLGGIDPRNGESKPFMFSNSNAIIHCDNFQYDIQEETNNYKRYYINYFDKNIRYPIYILHIHSKKLDKFFI